MREKIYDAITNIDEKLIEEAQTPPHRKNLLRRWVSIAAVAVIILSAGAYGISRFSANVEAPNSGDGGSSHAEGTVFMSYAGPVLPLTLAENNDTLRAQRRISFNFSPRANEFSEVPSVRDISVTDQYTLSNPSDSDITATVLYPFVGNLNNPHLPLLTADGQEAATQLFCGPYTGGFRGAGDETSTSLNLSGITSWEGYQALLEDGSYLKAVFSDYPVLSQPITVYKLTDLTDDGSSGGTNPTMDMCFTIDPAESTILTYGFNGGSYDPATGENHRHISIPKDFSPWYGAPCYLAVLGEDIGEYTLQAYEDGGCEKGEEINSASVNIFRSETTLGELLREIARTYYDQLWVASDSFTDRGGLSIAEPISFEMYYGELCRFFAEHGPLGTSPKERYQWGMLDDIVQETPTHDRVFYLSAQITVPTGSSVVLSAEQTKEPSFDFFCGDQTNAGLQGYDMMTHLGSNLNYDTQTAALTNTDLIEIVRQNFGFDLDNNITAVTLDPNVPHYYLEIRQIKN